MNKKIVQLLFFICITNSAFASYLWNIDNGIDEYCKGNFNYSKDYFLTYLKSNPNDEDGYWWLAKTYQKLQDSENSILNFEKSYIATFSKKDLDKINFDVKKNSNIEDYFDMAVQFYSNGNYKEADFYADMMLKLDSKSASAYFIKAKIAKTLKDEDKAIEYLNQAIIYNNDILKTNLAKTLKIAAIPNSTKEIYKYNALELYYKGEVKEAIVNAKKYLDINSNIDMTNFLINLYIKDKNTEQAKNLIEEAKNKNLANIQTYIYESKIQDNNEKAEKILLEAYKINPNNPDLLLNLGNLYLRKNDYNNSLKYFEALNLVNSELYEGYFGLAYSMLMLNKTEEAIPLIRKMNEKNPNSSENLFLLSFTAKNQKSYTEAIEYLDEAIKKDKNAIYYLEKAKIHYLLKNYKESLESLNTISKINNNANKNELSELFIKNYLKLNMPQEAQKILSDNDSLDKNRIIYKYYLYNLCKLESNNSNSCQRKFKIPKPATLMDFVDVSEIQFEQNNYKEALKTIDSGIKKYTGTAESSLLLNQKNKLEYYDNKY